MPRVALRGRVEDSLVSRPCSSRGLGQTLSVGAEMAIFSVSAVMVILSVQTEMNGAALFAAETDVAGPIHSPNVWM